MTRRVDDAGRARGTALVEFMISLLVLVPVLLYSIFLQDALYARLKAQEAVAAAAWDFTGHLLHNYDNYNHPLMFNKAKADVEKNIKKVYGALDAWDERMGGGASGWLTGAGARAQLSSIRCEQASAGSLDVGQAAAEGTKLHEGGLIQCQTQARIENFYLDQKTEQGEILQGDSIWPSDLLGSISVCGIGTPASKSCGISSSFTIFTDDWGLGQDGSSDPSKSWPDQDQNKHFSALSKAIHDTTPSLPWIPYDVLVDGPELDTEFGSSELAYQAGTPADGASPSGAGNGSPTVNTEAGSQVFNTWPSDHGTFEGVPQDAYQTALSQRVDRYLGR